MTECGFLCKFLKQSTISWPAATQHISKLTQWHFPTFPIMCTPAAILQEHSEKQQRNAPLPQTARPHYDLPHHLLYHTVYGASQAASNTASRGGNLSPSFCFPAPEHNIWRCICLMATALPFEQPLSLFLSESLLPPLSLAFLLLWSGRGRGGEECAGSNRERLVLCFFLRRWTIILP